MDAAVRSTGLPSGSLLAVALFVMVPCGAVVGRQLAHGEVEGGTLVAAAVLFWWIQPPLAVALAALPRPRWAGALVAWAAAGLVFPFLGGVVFVANEGLTLEHATMLAFAWAVSVVSAVVVGLIAVAAGGAPPTGERVRTASRTDRHERWSRALVAGLASCVLVGPIAIVIARDLLVAVAVCGFVVGANVLSWALARCSAAVVVHWVAVLGTAGVGVVALGPDPSPASVAALSLCFAALLGVLCSRSRPLVQPPG